MQPAGKLIAVLGLQHVGKSTYVDGLKRRMPDLRVIDYERHWNLAERAMPTMDQYEISTYIKLTVALELEQAMKLPGQTIVVEGTGMSKVSQAALGFMMERARAHGYDVEVHYLRPRDYGAYVDLIQDDPDAMNMWRDYSRGHPRWREPIRCPYFFNVQVHEIDHYGDEDAAYWREHEENRRLAQAGVL